MSAAAPRGLRAGTTGPVSGRFRFPPVPGGPFRSSAGSSGPRTGHGLSIPSDPELARSGLPETASREGLVLLAPGLRDRRALMAVTGHAGSLAVPVPPCVSPRQLAELPGPRIGHWVRVVPGVAAAAPAPAPVATDYTSPLVCPVPR